MAAQILGIDRMQGVLGYVILNEDGAVLNVSVRHFDDQQPIISYLLKTLCYGPALVQTLVFCLQSSGDLRNNENLANAVLGLLKTLQKGRSVIYKDEEFLDVQSKKWYGWYL